MTLYRSSKVSVAKRLWGAQLFKGYHIVIWLRCLTCGLSKWGWGLFGCPHTSPLSWEQLANYSTCGETHTHTHTSYTWRALKHICRLSHISRLQNHILQGTRMQFNSIPLQEPPCPVCRLKRPICFFLWGLWGQERGWNTSKRGQRPLSKSPLITPPINPTFYPQTQMPHVTQPRWTWAWVNCRAAPNDYFDND